jgi:hypothetical protein
MAVQVLENELEILRAEVATHRAQLKADPKARERALKALFPEPYSF